MSRLIPDFYFLCPLFSCHLPLIFSSYFLASPLCLLKLFMLARVFTWLRQTDRLDGDSPTQFPCFVFCEIIVLSKTLRGLFPRYRSTVTDIDRVLLDLESVSRPLSAPVCVYKIGLAPSSFHACPQG